MAPEQQPLGVNQGRALPYPSARPGDAPFVLEQVGFWRGWLLWLTHLVACFKALTCGCRAQVQPRVKDFALFAGLVGDWLHAGSVLDRSGRQR